MAQAIKLKDLPKEIRDIAVKRHFKEYPSSEYTEQELWQKNLSDVFNWADTIEGDGYWRKLAYSKIGEKPTEIPEFIDIKEIL